MGRIGKATVLLLGLIVAGTASAQMYKWVDKDGKVVYSQVPPPDDRPVTTIKAPKSPSAATRSSPVKTHDSEPQEGTIVTTPEEAAAAKAKVEAENLVISKKNCVAARENLKIYNTSRRVQKDNEIIALDDKKRQELVQEAQEQIQTYCK